MVFIVDGQRIATENFLVGQLYKIIYKNENIVYAMCEGIGHDFVMFISDNPRIITLNIETAQTIESIMPAEAGSMYDYNDLINKPTINNIALIGNLTSSELGLQTTLNTAQMAAVNSGIDNTKVEQIATNTTAIGNKQDVIDSSHKLSADLVDDSSSTNKFATAAQLAQISTNQTNILSGNVSINNAYINVPISTCGTELVNGYINGGSGVISYGEPNRACSQNLFAATSIQSTNNYVVFGVFCYDKTTNEYIGRITTTGTVSTSGSIKYATEFDLSAYSNYLYRIQVKQVGDENFVANTVTQYIVCSTPAMTTTTSIPDTKYITFGKPNLYTPTAITGEDIDAVTVSDVYSAYDSLVSSYPNFIRRGENVGKDSNDAAIRSYIVGFDKPVYALYDILNERNYYNSDMENKHILITAGVHGDEKSSVVGVKDFITELLSSTDDWAVYLKTNYIIHVIPIVNTYGFDNNQRTNKNGDDINRDFTTFATPEAQAVKRCIDGIGTRLKVIVDSHNTTEAIGYIGTRPEYKNHLLYCRTGTNLAANLYPYLSTIYNANKYPYFFTWQSTNSTTLSYYGNTLDVLSITIETPRNYSGGETNNSEISPLVKGILANVLPTYGEIG